MLTRSDTQTRKGTQKVLRLAGVLLATAALGACVSPSAGPSGVYARPIGNAPVTANPTAYSNALVCLGGYARSRNLASPRMAVGRISDYTGKVELEGGRKITQGASLMAMTALAKAGARQVERFDTSVSELELKYANNKLITDNMTANPTAPGDYRKIVAGQIAGSDFHIVGGITELNYNIRSSGVDAYVGDADPRDPKGLINGRLYVMNVALDLRLVDTRTLEVVDVISYQKQIIGREVRAGVFDFFNGNIFDISAGEGALEPMQLAVRALIERATLEFMANLYGASGPEVCLSAQDDFLNAPTTGLTGMVTPAYDNLDTNNARTREDPKRWRNVDAPKRGDAQPVAQQPVQTHGQQPAGSTATVPAPRRSRY
ncbi:MAG: holdfast anchoring protein HfaB [Asticcacaulis sp.]